ncbi:hypothetical protein [Brevundimonas sp. SORGH_AS_0993]|uniref:hypothetical protein n=1 Tax=Brevundimonas sp. SORGH_AS_0993 TaxID=3041794 RepID=UPI0027842FB2|nr:hypothetical protein [Brevundimonas sp. SORGH_AS_0993]MDQ1153036.1 hypothetical protein [Brevundimonas sp. SORGH_AS_0993]
MLDFRKPQAFSGRLSRGGDHHDVAFKLTLTPSGSLVFDFEELAFTKATAWLRGPDDRGETVSYFSLVAQSGEVTLTTDHLHLNAPVHDDQEGSYLALKGQAQLATLTASRTHEEPFLRMGLRGFQGFGRHQVETALGTIYVGGGTAKPVDEPISGFITVVAPSGVADRSAWRAEAGRLLEYLRLMTSFAAGRNLKGPTLEYASETEWTLEVLEQAGGGDTHQPVIHFLNQQAFVRAAVDAWFEPVFKVEQLMFALEWYVMAAGYTEMRLVQAMTVLENLSHANLTFRQSHFLPPTQFKRLSTAMRAAAPMAQGDPDLEALLTALPGKMADLNRRPLKDKVRLLMKQWNVPVGDLDLEALDRAVNVRNEIVHRGHYRADEPRSSAGSGLWPHVQFVREIIARIVFAMIAYEGQRIGWIGGYHLTTYPPSEV